MTHLRLALVIVCLVTLSTGCRMCSSKFDYCGPTVMGGCGEECGPCAPRSGSILTGAAQEAAYAEQDYYVESEPTTPTGELTREDFDAPIMPRQMVEGEEIEGIIISVEDNGPQKIAKPQALPISDAKPTPSPSGAEGWSVKQ